MSRLTLLAGAALGSLLIAGFVQPPVLELGDTRPETAQALPASASCRTSQLYPRSPASSPPRPTCGSRGPCGP